MKNLISVNIIGGLGNHLFKIAAILYYIKNENNKEKREIVFKNEDIIYDVNNMKRKTFWNTLFKDKFRLIEPSEYFSNNFIKIYEYRDHIHQEFNYNINNNIILNGHFQSFKYINDNIHKKMINYIYSNADLMLKAYNEYNKIKLYFGNNTEDNDIVSLHIRRTDYITLNNYYYNLEKDYYSEALNIANKKYIVVFSDDIEWCKENINNSWFNYDKIFFVNIENENNVEIEFILMSLFQHNIIANSTFSLWASFISTYQKPKIVIAPKKWYGINGPKNWEELYHKKITNII